MKSKILLQTVALCALLPFAVNAQQGGFPCGSSYYNDLMKQLHPAEVNAAEQELQQETDYALQHQQDRTTTSYIIPVVFHIVHDYGAENISDAQILDEMMILNRDYAKLNPDTGSIIPQFMTIASETNIEFRLATIDPDGNCTNGIDRIASKKTYQADDASKLNPWPRQKYLNVWVVNSIGANGVAGYAYYPSSVDGIGLNIDGVLILSNYIGSIGTSSPTTSRALTHEIGHWMNLSHPWGSTNSPGVACGDDGIPDTPKTKGWNHCPTPSTAAICDTGIVENYQNYMDYSYCSCMFTHDQVIAMHATLNSNVSDRNHLWRPDNLVATGTATTTASSCAPNADFHGNRRMVCPGGTITYTDDSWNGTVSS
ncbi:MAG TPA: M43 family zinc metalloprotease, partial [Bacteroidia bacterium]|nr:M43 family zinc metalloprotease [Bacteroidia bacterium]